MPAAFPLVDVAVIRSLVGVAAFGRAKDYARAGRVAELEWDPELGRITADVSGTGTHPYHCVIYLIGAGRSLWRPTTTACSCPVRVGCKHVGAALLVANGRHVQGDDAFAAPSTADARGTRDGAPGSGRPGSGGLGQGRSGQGRSGTGGTGGTGGTDAPADWRVALGGTAASGPHRTTRTPLALRFEPRESVGRNRSAWQRSGGSTVAAKAGAVGPVRIGMRPVTPGARDWTGGDVTWSTIPYSIHRLDIDERTVEWFRHLLALSRAHVSPSFGHDADRLYLDDFTSPLLWQLLAEAEGLGIPLVGKGPHARVTLAGEARILVDAARRDDGDLVLNPHARFTTPDRDVDAREVTAVATHGVYLLEWGAGPELLLAPTAAPLTDTERRMLAGGRVVVPSADTTEFFEAFYPALQREIGFESADATVDFPVIEPPTLVLAVAFGAEHRAELRWSWEGVRDAASETETLAAAERAYGGRIEHVADAPAPADRDGAPDRDAAVAGASRGRDAAGPARRSRASAPARRPRFDATVLTGFDTADFVEHTLPRLEALEHVRVDITGERPEYRELTETPTLTVSTVETERTDWFDLGVMVHVGERRIPFEPLFRALARGDRKLMLIDKTYLSLRQPMFEPLKQLIAEAQELDEWEVPGLHISRYQAGLWADFEDLADESVQAVAWRETVGRLLELTAGADARGETGADARGETGADARGDIDAAGPSGSEADAGADAADAPPDATLTAAVPPPAGLHADLRPYQLEGFRWLAFLWRSGLGGVLADDMGLGKTVQALALIAHAREHPRATATATAARATTAATPAAPATATDRDRADAAGSPTPPFLVVAPTSVVANWAAEAVRFTPGLRTATITATQRKARASLAEQIAGADIVITSYTLFRLEFDDYDALEWSGLLLDEAQFVKNHTARAHRCARDLRAPFKLAITGTPMENNLMELWAMFDITAPGLFASARRFREQYVTPIEAANAEAKATPAAHGAELTRRLRRRIRPLMLRRTKEAVAPEMPEKQEQVLEVELAPKHRRLYDMFLQRERQKLLGLIDDLDRNRFIVFRSLTLLRMLALDAALVDEQYEGIGSSKLDALIEQLDDVLAEGHRTLIFSQFTTYLHRVADRLTERGIAHVYLDGSTRGRAKVIERFREGDAPVFLISLKAGGFGLNLTEADYVFLLDPWWNPASEDQAVDRTHRIGQEKNVMVYRLVARGTIEEKVMALKAQKAALVGAVLDDDGAFSGALSAEDIRGLLE